MRWDTDLTRYIQKEQAIMDLPILTSNLWEWSTTQRKYMGKRLRDFKLEKYWEDIYKDESSQMVLAFGRQCWKTSFFTDIIGCCATSTPGSEILYIVDRPDRLALVSKQRIRKEVFCIVCRCLLVACTCKRHQRL